MVKNGRQAALMAPTEILARQHFGTLNPLMERLGIRCALLTGSTPARMKKTVCGLLKNGEIDFIVGTHVYRGRMYSRTPHWLRYQDTEDRRGR